MHSLEDKVWGFDESLSIGWYFNVLSLYLDYARCRKGIRVYAMYPMTTSLYPATAIDNTTFCCDKDDIIVVEFDGDEGEACYLD